MFSHKKLQSLGVAFATKTTKVATKINRAQNNNNNSRAALKATDAVMAAATAA
jgi:hypothetical protein